MGWGSIGKAFKKAAKVVGKVASMGVGGAALSLGIKALVKPPKLGGVPGTPGFEDPAVQAAAEEERRRLLNARGRASTILTGGQGLLDPAATASRTLLGGG